METSNISYESTVALLGAPAGMRRMTVAVSDLRPGDVIVGGRGREGARLTVAAVDGLGACCIVDFTDGTATAPLMGNGLVAIDRATEGGAS